MIKKEQVAPCILCLICVFIISLIFTFKIHQIQEQKIEKDSIYLYYYGSLSKEDGEKITKTKWILKSIRPDNCGGWIIELEK